MKKTLLITVIAIALIISIAGTCFALYKEAATPKVVNITATEGDACTLTIGTNTSLDFSGISPSNTTKSVDITLSTSNNEIVDGVHGIFKVALSGDLAAFIDVTVNEIPSVGGVAGSAVADATTNSGADIALSALPKYYRVTMTLNQEGIEDFDVVAEATGTITVSWNVKNDSVFTEDTTKYYVVGVINGVTSWTPSATTPMMTSPGDGTDLAKITVTLAAGDEFKVYRNGDYYGSWSPATADFTNNNQQIYINTAGSYTIRLDAEGHSYITKN